MGSMGRAGAWGGPGAQPGQACSWCTRSCLPGPAAHAHAHPRCAVQLMMVAGPKGITTAEAAGRAVDLGWATWDPSSIHVRR